MTLAAGEQLSGGQVKDSDQRTVVAVENPGGGAVGVGTTTTPSIARIEDASSTQLASVAQQHLGDGQVQPAAGGALLTSGPAQVTDGLGLASRLRQAGSDLQPPLGIQSGIASLQQEFLTTCSTTVAVGAGPVNATSAVSSAGVALTVSTTNGMKVGGVLNFEPGTANYEPAYIKSVNSSTSVTVVFGATGALFAHASPYAVQAFLANQERDFAGEGPTVAGTGAAIATEFESNSGGPPLASGMASGLTLDADRNFQGKNTAQLAITATTAGATSLTFSGNPWTSGLIVQQALYLSVGANGSAVEEVIVSKNNTPGTGAGPVTVNLVNPVVTAGSTFATFDIFGLLGPGAAQTTVLGIEDNLEYVYDVNAVDPKRPLAPMIAATGDALPGKNVPAESEALWNGSGFDRARTNLAVALTSQTATTATYTSPDQLNVNGHALHVILNLTALTGTTPTATVTINAKSASGVYYALLTSAVITATGVTVLRVGPALTAAANLVANDWVPRTFQVVVTLGGTTPAATYTLDYNLSE